MPVGGGIHAINKAHHNDNLPARCEPKIAHWNILIVKTPWGWPMVRALLIVGVIIFAVVFPLVGILICSVVIALQVTLMLVRIVASFIKTAADFGPITAAQPVFSVHVATHNEPPHMVIATLRSLKKQQWPSSDFEVIVMDNNTEDRSLWQPVSDFCRAQGRPFVFLHSKQVEGAKAGALNISLQHTRRDATHIVTVDADYAVAPEFLIRAAQALRRTGADYVQFPQAYKMSGVQAAGVDTELEEYFRSSAKVADGTAAVLLTGTLCVISRQALVATGGWSSVTTTEDAELGIRLCKAGYNGRFIDEVVGRGQLPLSLIDLEEQRYRWASGNLHTLLHHVPSLVSPGTRLPFSKRLAILSQLTAWLNLAFLPAVLLIATLALQPAAQGLIEVAGLGVILAFLDIGARILHRAVTDGLSLTITCSALASRIALAPVSAMATIDVIFGRRMPFKVTLKSLDQTSDRCTLPLAQMLLATLGIAILPLALVTGPIASLAALLMVLPFPAAVFTGHTLIAYRKSLVLSSDGATA